MLNQLRAFLAVGREINGGLETMFRAIDVYEAGVTAANARLRTFEGGKASQQDREFMEVELNKIQASLTTMSAHVDVGAVKNFDVSPAITGLLQQCSEWLSVDVLGQMQEKLEFLFRKAYETPGAGQLIGAAGILIGMQKQIKDAINIMKNRTSCEKWMLALSVGSVVLILFMFGSYLMEKIQCIGQKN